tara:strand:+ start:448 stop:1059 length:612 start_codon:yes stop_codon:yes gene_type:complete
MSISNLFPTPVYKFSLAGHETYKKRLVKVLEQKFKDDPDSKAGFSKLCNTWQCHHSEVGVNLKDIYNEIIAEAMKYINQLTKHTYYTIADSWFNVHTSDMYQEVHEHTPSFISGNYYIQFDPEKDKSIIFINENKTFLYSSWAMNLPITKPELFSKYQLPDVKEGDVVLFPSTLNHMVAKSEPHNQLRITNSFNIMPISPTHK